MAHVFDVAQDAYLISNLLGLYSTIHNWAGNITCLAIVRKNTYEYNCVMVGTVDSIRK